jgi:DNA-binding response OmpR family regulator
VEAVARRVPSVAILDLRMPGMNGIELTAHLRGRPQAATVPIIVVTASGGSDDWRRLAELGADRLLVKPVVMDDLVALVRRVLRERRRRPLRTVA